MHYTYIFVQTFEPSFDFVIYVLYCCWTKPSTSFIQRVHSGFWLGSYSYSYLLRLSRQFYKCRKSGVLHPCRHFTRLWGFCWANGIQVTFSFFFYYYSKPEDLWLCCLVVFCSAAFCFHFHKCLKSVFNLFSSNLKSERQSLWRFEEIFVFNSLISFIKKLVFNIVKFLFSFFQETKTSAT